MRYVPLMDTKGRLDASYRSVDSLVLLHVACQSRVNISVTEGSLGYLRMYIRYLSVEQLYLDKQTGALRHEKSGDEGWLARR